MFFQVLFRSKGCITDMAWKRSFVLVSKSHVSNHMFFLTEAVVAFGTNIWPLPFMDCSNVFGEIFLQKERRSTLLTRERPISLMDAGYMLL